MERNMTATAENGWELSVTRLIAAPPEKVWDVMTNRINEWWCPAPWRAEFDTLERRAGGVSNCTMYGPDGEVHPHPGYVLAWDEGHRFAFTDAVVGDLMPAGKFRSSGSHSSGLPIASNTAVATTDGQNVHLIACAT